MERRDRCHGQGSVGAAHSAHHYCMHPSMHPSQLPYPINDRTCPIGPYPVCASLTSAARNPSIARRPCSSSCVRACTGRGGCCEMWSASMEGKSAQTTVLKLQLATISRLPHPNPIPDPSPNPNPNPNPNPTHILLGEAPVRRAAEKGGGVGDWVDGHRRGTLGAAAVISRVGAIIGGRPGPDGCMCRGCGCVIICWLHCCKYLGSTPGFPSSPGHQPTPHVPQQAHQAMRHESAKHQLHGGHGQAGQSSGHAHGAGVGGVQDLLIVGLVWLLGFVGCVGGHSAALSTMPPPHTQLPHLRHSHLSTATATAAAARAPPKRTPQQTRPWPGALLESRGTA